MKTEWKFPFEASDLYFEREHNFVGDLKARQRDGSALYGPVDLHVRIVPDAEQRDERGKQTGSLYVTMPGRPDEVEEIAYQAAREIGERITFKNAGAFRVGFGLVTSKLIAESDDEAAEIGDKPYQIRFVLTEVTAPPVFQGTALSDTATNARSLALISQFNETKGDTSLIRKFLGYFRILESLSLAESPRAALKPALKANSVLRKNFEALEPTKSFDAFVEAIVEMRHECAHLKVDSEYGLSPIGSRTGGEAAPYIPLLEELAYRCIVEHPY